MKTFTVDSLVYSPEEHARAIGKVIRIADGGYVIEFTTPPSATLPYGCINTEFWSFEDAQMLIGITA